MNYTFVILVLVFVAVSSPVFADEYGLSLSPTQVSLNLQHSEYESLTFYVSNQNDFCDLECGYVIFEGDIEEPGFNDEGEFINYAGQTNSFSTSLRAPTKSASTVPSGTTPFTLLVGCVEDPNEESMFCGGPEEIMSMTINVKSSLSPAEQDAYDELESVLPPIKSALESAEIKKNFVDSRLDELPRNMIKNDLIEIYEDHAAEFSSYKSNYDTTLNMQDNLDFIGANSNLDKSLQAKANQLESDFSILDKDIDTRIEEHNEAADLVNTLPSNLQRLSEDAARIGLVNKFRAIESDIEALSNRFNNGDFSSYAEIKNDVTSINAQINDLEEEIELKQQEAIEKAKDVLNSEVAQLCNVKSVCDFSVSWNQDAFASKQIDSICDAIKNQISSRYVEVNDQELQQYHTSKSQVESYNTEASSLNAQISEINEIAGQIAALVNKEGLDSDISNCKQSVLSIATMVDGGRQLPEEELLKNTKTECSNTLNSVKQEVESEQSFFSSVVSWFKKIVRTVKKISIPEISQIESKVLPSKPVPIQLLENTQDFLTETCDVEPIIYAPQTTAKTSEYIAGVESSETSVKEGAEFKDQCCPWGVCQPCCVGDECRDDPTLFPIVFVHGHSFNYDDDPVYSLNTFNLFQYALIGQKYLSGGVILPTDSKSDFEKGDWDVGSPYTVKTTYYVEVFNDDGEIISQPSKLASIEDYADRLADNIEVIMHRTNKDKVILIAHSMGGLVSRQYIKENPGKVQKLIMLGTPNAGYPPGGGIACKSGGYDLLAEDECNQMHPDHRFMSEINKDKTPGSTKYYTIAGQTEIGDCLKNWAISGRDDCVIQVNSVHLEGAEHNEIISAEHNELLESEEALELVLDFLKD